MTSAAIYARVSSERQKEDQTIGSQTAALRTYAASSGLEVPKEWVFEDEGFSGATLIRPALERLRDLAAQIHVEVVLCYSPDRLARKYAYQALLIEEFARSGTAVRFLKGPKAETAEDELLLQFQGMIAEYEKAQIAERTRRGKAHRARAGSVNVLSGAPYGYRYVRKSEEADARYEIDEQQAVTVQEIFRRYVEDSVSIGTLARSLTAEGTPTAKGRRVWDRSTIWAILRNPAYSGRAAFSKTVRVELTKKVTRHLRRIGGSVARRPASRERPRQEWIEIPVPAIVSQETFELAARRLQDNKHFAARRTKEPSLLQGLVACRGCGYSYYRTSTRTTKRKLYYYRCLGSDDFRHPNGRVCENRPVRQDYLDALVWNHVTTLLSDPELIRRELDRRLKELRSTSLATAQKGRLEIELTRAGAAHKRLLDAYQAGLLSLEELRERMPELRKKQSTVKAQITALEDQILDEETYLRLAESLESFLTRLRGAAVDSSIQERQRILRLVIKEVLVDRDRIVIRHSIRSARPDPGYPLRGQRANASSAIVSGCAPSGRSAMRTKR